MSRRQQPTASRRPIVVTSRQPQPRRRQAPSSNAPAILAAAAAFALSAHAMAAGSGTWITAGAGTWGASANWAGGTVADGAGNAADFSTVDLTADAVVHMDAAHTLGSLIFSDTDPSTAAGWTLDNNAVAANVLTLSTGTTAAPTITVSSLDPTKAATISAVIAGTSGFTKSGTGQLNLTGANTFSGPITVSGGTLGFTNNASFGANNAGNVSVTLDGTTLAYVGTSGGPTITRVIAITSNGATINTVAAGGNGKFIMNNSGPNVSYFSGSGTLTKTGPGWLTDYGTTIIGGVQKFTGDTHIVQGVLEAGNVNALGSGKVYISGGTADTTTGAITGGGFLSLNVGSGAMANEIHLDTATIGSDNPAGASFSGAIYLDGPARVQLGNFWGGGNSNVTFSGPLNGSGNITVAAGGGNPGGTVGTGQTLFINGDATAYSGHITGIAGDNVAIGNGLNVVPDNQITVVSNSTALGGWGMSGDPNAVYGLQAPNAFMPAIVDNTTDTTTSTKYGGVFGINNGTGASIPWNNTPIDLATLYSGAWYLGSQSTGTYAAPSLGAASDHVYRLGGGGGTLNIATANVVTGANAVNIGAAMANGGGTIRFGAAQNYTGATNIINGTLSIGANNAIPANSVITFGGPNYVIGTTTFNANGTLDLNGFNQTLNQPIGVATGADATKQTITNNGAATSTLTLDTSTAAGVQTFAGPVKDGSKPLGLVVTGSNAANGLVLPNAATSVTGGVSVNRVSLTVGPASGAPNAAKVGGPVSLTNGGALVLNSTVNMNLGVLSGNGSLVHSGSGNLTLGANNSGFSGSITVNGGGTVTAGLATPGVLPLGSSAISLAGGKLALQGQMTSTGVVQNLAPVTTLSGWNKDTIYAKTDAKYFSNNLDRAGTGGQATDANNSLMDGYYTYYENGFAPAENGMLNYTSPTTPLGTGTGSGGLPSNGQITSPRNNPATGTPTPFQLQSYTANNTLQILGGKNGFHQGTLTLTTPSGFKNFAVLSVSSWATNDTPNVTVNFADGTSVTTTYNSYDWYVNGEATKQAADVIGGMLNRYSPFQAIGAGTPGSGGWDARDWGIYETDIDLTNIGGVDYSGKVVTSFTFDGLMSNTAQDQRTNVFAVSGQAIPVATNATQTYANTVAVTADSSVDVSGSLNAVLGTLSLGAKLSATSSDNTASPYSLTFGATTLSGNAAVDVAKSTGNGNGTVALGAVSGSGSLTKSGVGTLKLAAGGNISGALALNGGTLEVDANTTAGSLAGNGGALNVAAGALTVGPSTGTAARLSSLTVAAGAKLGLNNNNLAIDYTGSSPADSIRQLLLSGRNGGTWTGNGIASAAAAGNADHDTGFAYVEASTLLGLSGSATATWNGATVDATTLLVKYTWTGDLNLDGKVNADDYALADRGLAKGLTGWSNGDVNYDNVVNAADFLLIDTAYAHQTGPLSADFLAMRQAEFGDAYVAQLIAAVPEPTSLSLLGLAALPLLSRRRRSTH